VGQLKVLYFLTLAIFGEKQVADVSQEKPRLP
jgi:hypothetical protein